MCTSHKVHIVIEFNVDMLFMFDLKYQMYLRVRETEKKRGRCWKLPLNISLDYHSLTIFCSADSSAMYVCREHDSNATSLFSMPSKENLQTFRSIYHRHYLSQTRLKLHNGISAIIRFTCRRWITCKGFVKVRLFC